MSTLPPIQPGVVTQTEPLLVRLATDETGQPCQRLAPAELDERGAVMVAGGQRVWLGGYDPADTARALAEQVQRVADQTTSAQEAVNVVDETVTELGVDVTAAVDEAHAAALAAAEASGTLVSPLADPLPATRRNGGPLQPGDLLYLAGPVVPGQPLRIEGVRTWTGSEWVQHVLVAEHVIATDSIVSDLIAAEVELVAPVITGGTFQTQPEPAAGVKLTDAGLQQWDRHAHRVGHFMGAKAFLERLTFHDDAGMPEEFVPAEVARTDLGLGEIGLGATSGKASLNGSEAWLYLTNTGGVEIGHSREGHGSVTLLSGSQQGGLDLHGHRRDDAGSFTFNSLSAVANGGTVWSGTITHGLGVEPTFAAAEVVGASADRRRWTAQVISRSATTIQVMVVNYTPSATAAGLSTTLMWHVVA